jgi:hypothetical protein
MTSDLAALVAGVLVDLDGAGALADALQEAGREKEAVLLRRRWVRWKTERAKEVEVVASLVQSPFREVLRGIGEDLLARSEGVCDHMFREYVRTRFKGTVGLLEVRQWIDSFGLSHIVVTGGGSGAVRTACGGIHIGGELLSRFGRRICRKCRARLPDLNFATPEATT